MVTRRINYLLVWIGCVIFFWAYRQWISWFALVIVTLLPLLSLLFSLPAVLTANLRFDMPEMLTAGTPCVLQLCCKTISPTLLWECSMMLTHSPSGHQQKIENGTSLPTEHCGILSISVKKVRLYDYLGLFRFPVRMPHTHSLIIRPVPVESENLPNLSQISSQIKQISDLGENCEPRPYHPGDMIQQIHWKLSAKTGSLILNESVGSDRGRVLLRLALTGTESELDEKLGKLLWLGIQLLNSNIPCDIECFTANGYENWHVSTHETLLCVVDIILSRKSSTTSPAWDQHASVSLQYDIGGEPNET
jgi:hypothetical protein